jgi:hypothetical protein
LFSVNQKEVKESDIVLTLTPRIIQRAGLSVDDLKSYIIEGGVPGTVTYEAPAPVPRQPQNDRQRLQ